jgi:hypothetical protein
MALLEYFHRNLAAFGAFRLHFANVIVVDVGHRHAIKRFDVLRQTLLAVPPTSK